MLKGSHDFLGLNHNTSRFVWNTPLPENPIDFDHDLGVLATINDLNGNPIGKASDCNWLYVYP